MRIITKNEELIVGKYYKMENLQGDLWILECTQREPFEHQSLDGKTKIPHNGIALSPRSINGKPLGHDMRFIYVVDIEGYVTTELNDPLK